MAAHPNGGDGLCLMSGQFVAAARLHLDSVKECEAAKEPLDQERFALSVIICAASALDAVTTEAKALHQLDDPHGIAPAIASLNDPPAKPILGLLKFVPEPDQPDPNDLHFREVCAAYFLRNKFVHYDAVWAREWPDRLENLGITWSPRDPLFQAAPGTEPARPQFPDDVLCSEGVEWVINACTTFLDWWSSAVGKQPWWEGRMVPSKVMIARFAARGQP